MTDNRALTRSILIPLRLVLVMWAIFLLQSGLGLNLQFMAILPRTLTGLLGVATSPLIHGSQAHLLSNSFPMLFLGTSLYMFYGSKASQVFIRSYFMPGLLVWIFARNSYHIGASGVIYALAFFLIFYGFFKKDFMSLMISIVVVVLYGSLFYGILPTQAGVSWESLLLGGVVGFINALTLGRK